MVKTFNKIENIIGYLFIFILILSIFGGMAGDLLTAADDVSGTGAPLAGLFSSTGVVIMAIMAGFISWAFAYNQAWFKD